MRLKHKCNVSRELNVVCESMQSWEIQHVFRILFKERSRANGWCLCGESKEKACTVSMLYRRQCDKWWRIAILMGKTWMCRRALLFLISNKYVMNAEIFFFTNIRNLYHLYVWIYSVYPSQPYLICFEYVTDYCTSKT